jgi:hypothetical protein
VIRQGAAVHVRNILPAKLLGELSMTPITGTVQAVEDGSSGKTLRVQVNNQWFSSKDFGMRGAIGQVITFTPSSSEFRGKTYYWINDYTQGTTGASPANGQGQAKPAANTDNLAYLPMTSNLVAHAIAAGKIETPSEIRSWAQAAFEAARSLIEGEPSDDIPF